MSETTLMVIGAGASRCMDDCFLVGREFASNIGHLLDWTSRSTTLTQNYLSLLAQRSEIPLADLRTAAGFIADRMPQTASIDAFIHNHKGNRAVEFVAKLAIVRAVLDMEEKSTKLCRLNHRDAWNGVRDSWLTDFTNKLVAGCQADTLAERFRTVKFIIFNYDRVVEHFLYEWLNHYWKNSIQTAELLHEIEFCHPYGVLGDLPWQQAIGDPPSGPTIAFGEEIASGTGAMDKIVAAALTRIRTVSESTELSDLIRQHYRDARRVVFLGFHYDPLNLRLLDVAVDRRAPRYLLGTAYGRSTEDILRIGKLLAVKGGGPDPMIRDSTCARFMSEHSLALQFPLIP